tara:strand:- start:37846 stop:40794 length:2949 start_codon:yes stop_codon:yes gene_type:complete
MIVKKINYSYLKLVFIISLITQTVHTQEYPFTLPNTITASLNVNTSDKEAFNNKLIGYNIQGFKTQVQQDFIKLVDPVTIRFPHGVWANFYEWETDGYQQDSYDNRDHQDALDIFVRNIKGDIGGIAELNNDKKASNNGKGYDMMWTYTINFDDGASSVARAKKDIGLGFEVKAIELGNEHFWRGQRSLRTETPEMYLAAAKEVSSALKAEFPEIKLSLPLSWRRSHTTYNNTIKGDGNFFDAITLHKYVGADPDVPGESDKAYSSILTAKLQLEEDANWVRTFAPGKPIWLTEWGVSASNNDEVHAAACLGMTDVYMFMAENQDVYERANWFIFNRVLNAMVVLDSNKEPLYPLQKRAYLSTYEIIQDVFRDATMLNGTITSSAQLTVSKGAVNAVNARATTDEFGETKVIAVNLTNKPVTFELKFDGVVYAKSFKHEALVFDNLGPVENVPYESNQLDVIKEGVGTITLPPLSVSKISNIFFDESIQLIAGTIEAEAYKLGGQGIGFSDTTSDNTLSDGVDADGVDVGMIEDITFVGDTQNGEWLKYDINVLETADYDFEFIYTSINSGALISVEVDDVLVFDDFSLPQTSTATDFINIKKEGVSLTKGLHQLKLNIKNGGFNLDKISITKVATLTPAVFVTPSNGDTINPGDNIKVEASTTFPAGKIASLELFVNDQLVRSITNAPFKWGQDGQNDVLLEQIEEGTYNLKLVLTDDRNRKVETSITVLSNNYPTQPFGGISHKIPGTIQVEDYDLGGQGIAFSDSSSGNSGGVYRDDDVDIETSGTGFAVTSLSGNEYLRYTVNIAEVGKYQMAINYKTFASTSKPIAAYILPKDLSSSTELFYDRGGSSTSGIVKINGGGDFQEYLSQEFDLNMGLAVLELRIPQGGAGPSYDYIKLNKISALSVSDLEQENDKLKIYPIPSKNGIFNLSKDCKWEVYSIIGAKITEGSGTLINLSSLSKGTYILKTDTKIIKRLLYY